MAGLERGQHFKQARRAERVAHKCFTRHGRPKLFDTPSVLPLTGDRFGRMRAEVGESRVRSPQRSKPRQNENFGVRSVVHDGRCCRGMIGGWRLEVGGWREKEGEGQGQGRGEESGFGDFKVATSGRKAHRGLEPISPWRPLRLIIAACGRPPDQGRARNREAIGQPGKGPAEDGF